MGESNWMVRALPALAALGAAVAAYALATGRQETPLVAPQSPAPTVPDPTRDGGYIGATGVIEPASQEIAVGTPVAGIVSRVRVVPGDRVAAGDPLFEIDDRAARAENAVREAATTTARERVAVAEAALLEAKAARVDAQQRAARAMQLLGQRAIAREEADSRRAAADAAEARVARADADLREARAAVAESLARASQSRIDADLHRVAAPAGGVVLKVDVRAGEYAPTGRLDAPLVLIGVTEPMHVRVDIDEADIPRFAIGAPAMLQLRGAPNTRAQARFVRLEPLVVPKSQLSGAATERVDTRVLQAIYAIDPGEARVFPGQQVDVYLPPARPG